VRPTPGAEPRFTLRSKSLEAADEAGILAPLPVPESEQHGGRIVGKAKYLGGVGRKVTGITKRKFHPNLQRIRVELPDGTRKRMRVCAQCLRSGKVKKRSKRPAVASK